MLLCNRISFAIWEMEEGKKSVRNDVFLLVFRERAVSKEETANG